IPLLDRFDAASAALIAAALAGVAAACFGWARGVAGRRQVTLGGGVAVLLVSLGIMNANAEFPPLHPGWIKGAPENTDYYSWVGWNTYSRVSVSETTEQPPRSWAASRLMPPELAAPTPQRAITIDGAAATIMFEHGNELERHAHIDWDITSFAHRLRPTGPAAVIGVGGGRDVVVAARAGHTPVVGVELNDLIVELHTTVMAEFSGLTKIPGVELVSDEARSHMSREQRRFAVITMSLIDTWASTGAGSYSLSENGLYTVEAWQVFVDRLDDDGIFTVSRWYHPDAPGETARMLAL